MKKIIGLVLTFVFLLSIPVSLAEDDIARRYQQAQMLMEIGDYLTAAQILESLGEYKDSQEMLKQVRKHLGGSQKPQRNKSVPDSALIRGKEKSESGRYKVGDIIPFGRYEQDGTASNGPEPIEWIILKTDGHTAMMISRAVLAVGSYHDVWDTECTWEDCGLRRWLNSDFYHSAFSSTEQRRIQLTDVSADRNPFYDTDQGRDTKDNVFLLSIKEALDYLPNKDRTPQETPVITQQYNHALYWWLRTMGSDQLSAAYANGYEKKIENYGFDTCGDDANWFGIRPVIVIELQ